jgi:YebC/PmpR family DNA-binding regulatory protein
MNKNPYYYFEISIFKGIFRRKDRNAFLSHSEYYRERKIMAGHSKWANIKHKKAAQDKKKGKIFSKIAKEIMVSAKEGGGNPEDNSRLRNALASAKTVNMPKDNIDRAIKKGTGELAGVNFEEIAYEGYGPGGMAVLVECLTDNRNRTASEVRMVFDRNNGNLAGTGAVAWMFNRRSHFVVAGEKANEDDLMEIVLDEGAEDIEADGGIAEIWGPPETFSNISKALEKSNIETEEASLVQQPENTVDINDEAIATQALRLIDTLEDLDDVQAVYSNIEIEASILEKLG